MQKWIFFYVPLFVVDGIIKNLTLFLTGKIESAITKTKRFLNNERLVNVNCRYFVSPICFFFLLNKVRLFSLIDRMIFVHGMIMKKMADIRFRCSLNVSISYFRHSIEIHFFYRFERCHFLTCYRLKISSLSIWRASAESRGCWISIIKIIQISGEFSI